MRHIGRLVLMLSVLSALISTAVPAIADPADEAQFVDLINQSRAASGLGALTSFWDLTDDARIHTGDMIEAGQVYHSSGSQLGSYTTGWARLGENVGMGPNPSLLHQAFMNSSSHRANILGDYDLIGVGSDRAPDGTMFVTVLFMKSAAPTTTTTVPPPPPTTTTTTTPPTTTAPAPTTTTTTPPTATTMPEPPATTTTTTSPEAASSSPLDTEPESNPVRATLEASTGLAKERPAVKAAGAWPVRSVTAFRPIFADLVAGSGPIVVLSSNGFPLVIE